MASNTIWLSSDKAWEGRLAWSSETNIAGNYSDVYIYAGMWKTDGYLTSSNSSTYGTITVDGTEYSLIGHKQFEDEVCIFEDTIRVYHDSDGSKSISISLTCYGQSGTSLSGYTLSGSGTAVLDTIPRTSSLTASNGTLGKQQTLSISKASDDFTHTITYKCGKTSGTVCTKTSETSVTWTPPLSLASQNTTGTSVSIELTMTTYSGETAVGTVTATISCTIPVSSLTAANGKLGTEQSFSITKASTDCTHTITYKCGNASGTICDKTSATTVKWTPPLSLASQNTTGTSVSVVLTMTTYISGTAIRTVTKTISCTIPSSGLTVSNGTLGAAQKLTISRAASNLTHTITYACGSATETVCTKTTLTSVTWTPPLSLASQNTTGTKVEIKLTMTTYNGSSTIGSVSKTIYCAIPSSVVPSCSLTVTDAMGYESKYGAMLQGLSRFKITVNATEAYGSDITAYAVTANGSKYDTASVTTETLQAYGTLTISATVTDARSRKASASAKKTVLAYTAPGISKLDVSRCNENGSANDHGEFAKVVFAYTVTSLNSKNSVSCVLRYKKAVESVFTEVSFPDLSKAYSVTGYSFIFPADSASSYDVELAVSDNFHTAEKDTKASTGFTLMHWKADGTGMAIGKLSEKSYALEIALPMFDEDGNQFIGCEEGTSGIWKYRKWTNGACELWGSFTVSSQACTTAFGGLYRTEVISLNDFPFLVTDPVVVASFDPGGFLWVVSSASTTKPPNYYLVYPTSQASVSGKINLHVTGKW